VVCIVTTVLLNGMFFNNHEPIHHVCSGPESVLKLGILRRMEGFFRWGIGPSLRHYVQTATKCRRACTHASRRDNGCRSPVLTRTPAHRTLSRSMPIFEKLTVAQLQFPAFYGGTRFIIVTTRVRHWPSETMVSRYGEQLWTAKNGWSFRIWVGQWGLNYSSPQKQN
jgi:hypothetical protein